MKGNENKDTMEVENFDPKTQIYELGYLLVPTITDENLGSVYTSIKDLVANFKGEFISDDMPHMMVLAYPMLKVVANVRNKFDSAYFGWVKFEMSTSSILELKKKLDLDPNVIRFIILKTVRDNTIATKKFTYRDMSKKRVNKSTEGEEVVEINKEELDKEIDAMVEV
ncbi:MAG: 30S ribosomal protein S6 [bacterium]|nr:30S ribosomal protein S6 [bacterium]